MILRPCFALLGLSWLTVAVHGLHFYLKGDEEKCFLEELASDTLVEGHYKAVQWSEPDQDWKINPEMGIQVVVEVRLQPAVFRLSITDPNVRTSSGSFHGRHCRQCPWATRGQVHFHFT